GLVSRGQELESTLHDALRPLEGHALVEEIRGGLGLLGAVELKREVLEAVPGAAGLLGTYAREAGVVLRPFLRGVPISPPLIITPAEIQQLVEMIGTGLDTFERTHAEALASAVAT
ncbi:MAG: aminotransferase class III-fold pyridoxal phosphate-dependent enzyme, partial [Gaiellales bacterium]